MLVDVTEVQRREEQAIFDSSEVATKLFAGLIRAGPDWTLSNWKRHVTLEHRPPVEKVAERARSKVNTVIIAGWLEVRDSPVSVDWRRDSNGEMNVLTAEATVRVVRLVLVSNSPKTSMLDSIPRRLDQVGRTLDSLARSHNEA